MIRPDAKVLAIIVARIGDTLLVTPALRALRAAIPQGRLSVLAHPRRMEALQYLPFVDELEGITKTSAPARGWMAKNRYDLALVYGHDAALVRYALRASKRVIAFRQGEAELNAKLAPAVSEPASPMHAVMHRALLLDPLGLAATDLRLAWQVTADELAWAREWRGGHVAGGAPVIGLQMASFATKSHRDWPVSGFGELIARLSAEHAGARFVLLGDAAAADKAAPLLAAYPGQAVLAAGRLSLRQSAALMAGLDLYIGVDTGPTHIAGALGIPMVALYHCAYPGRNLAPLQHPACVAIEHPLTGTSTAATASMADIAVDDVSRAATDLLARGARR
ncbi:MAG: glycosyltransferase family 9 protein [Burkholderiales bacterium]|nr:glycosyltransferase family 9 protein [Burkholderiales bacterium]